MAALVSSGFSCCTQCPAPSMSTVPRSSVSQPSCTVGGVISSTTSWAPLMNRAGTSTLAPTAAGVSSQLRSRLRYQLMPPVKPVRPNSAM